MDSDGGELLDWEVLHSDSNSDSGSGILSSAASVQNDFDQLDSHSDGLIHNNYFSIESVQGEERDARTGSGTDVAEEGSESSDNPSWIEPTSEIQSPIKDSHKFWYDSGSDEPRFSGLEGKSELGFVGNENLLMASCGIEEIVGGNGQKLEDQSGEIGLGDMKVGNFEEKSEVGFIDNGNLKVPDIVNDEPDSTLGAISEVGSGKLKEGDDKKTIVWWKVPMEFFKFCVFRVNPVWTFSAAAAALMGFVFLGRRLYKMKKKARGLELKVTMDDKRVAQFMSRAARLNEAFSIVKRVPVIRPALPAVGVTQWPAMSLR